MIKALRRNRYAFAPLSVGGSRVLAISTASAGYLFASIAARTSSCSCCSTRASIALSRTRTRENRWLALLALLMGWVLRVRASDNVVVERGKQVRGKVTEKMPSLKSSPSLPKLRETILPYTVGFLQAVSLCGQCFNTVVNSSS